MSKEKIEEFGDRIDITNVLYRYAKGIDDKDLQQVLSCFAPDIEMDQLGRKVIGIDMLARLFRGEFGGPKSAIGVDRINASTHVLANILISLNGDLAKADTQGIANLHATRDDQDVFLVRGIRYLDEFRKVDGRWAICKRVHTETWQYEATPVHLAGT
jgi:ketosteroid isomerase-like protein